MEAIDLDQLVGNLVTLGEFEVWMPPALVVVMGFLVRIFKWLHDRYAEIASLLIAQALVWGTWAAEHIPMFMLVGGNVLTGFLVWLAGSKGIHKLMKQVTDKYDVEHDEDNGDDNGTTRVRQLEPERKSA